MKPRESQSFVQIPQVKVTAVIRYRPDPTNSYHEHFTLTETEYSVVESLRHIVEYPPTIDRDKTKLQYYRFKMNEGGNDWFPIHSKGYSSGKEADVSFRQLQAEAQILLKDLGEEDD